jgi:hypothetical protein
MSESALIVLGVPLVTTVLSAQCAMRLVRDNQNSTALGIILSMILFVGLMQTSWLERILAATIVGAQSEIPVVNQALRFLLIPILFGSLVLSIFSAVVERSTGSQRVGKLIGAVRPAVIGAFIVFSFSRAAELSGILSSMIGG